MPDIETLGHTKWDCKYHGVFIPTYRRKALSHEWRRHLGEVFRALAEQKECRIEEGGPGHMKADTFGKRYLHTFHMAFVTLQGFLR